MVVRVVVRALVVCACRHRFLAVLCTMGTGYYHAATHLLIFSCLCIYNDNYTRHFWLSSFLTYFLLFRPSSASGKDIPYEIVARREGDVAEIYADVSLAQKELGWKATRTLGAFTCVLFAL